MDLEDNVFLFKFRALDNVRMILNGGRWRIMGYLLALKQSYADREVKDVDFSKLVLGVMAQFYLGGLKKKRLQPNKVFRVLPRSCGYGS